MPPCALSTTAQCPGFPKGSTMEVAEFKTSLLVWRTLPLEPDILLDAWGCVLLNVIKSGIFDTTAPTSSSSTGSI
eukprot:4016247-Heterocapsa_arctica.AAC.1